MLEKLRKPMLCLFVLLSYMGAFKQGEAFGSVSIWRDSTFRIVLVIVAYFLFYFIFSSVTEHKKMASRVVSIVPIFSLLAVVGASYFLHPSPIGQKKLINFSITILPMCSIFLSLVKRKEDVVWPILFLFLFGTFMSCVSLYFKTPDPFYFLSTGQLRAKDENFWTYIQFGPLAGCAVLIGFIGFIEMNKRWLIRIAFISASLLCLGATIYSGERATPLLLAVLIPGYLTVTGRLFKILSPKFIPLLLIASVSIFFTVRFMNSDAGDRFRHRLEKAGVFSEKKYNKQVDTRLDFQGEFFKPFFTNIKSNPFLGVGPGNYFGENKGYYPHNMFLEIGGEEGFTGLVVYGWIIFAFLKGLFRLWQEKNCWALWALMVSVFYFMRTFKTGDIVSHRMFWFFVAYSMYASRLQLIKVFPSMSGRHSSVPGEPGPSE